MSASDAQVILGTLFDESTLLTLGDLSRMCSVEERYIVQLVEEGVLNVIAVDATRWQFNGSALRRARLAVRLERDLEINLAGVALALDLMDELEQLRRQLKARR